MPTGCTSPVATPTFAVVLTAWHLLAGPATKRIGFPLYRQEQELNRQGIHLSRQTMSSWILIAAEDNLILVYEQLHKEWLSAGTPRAKKKPESDSYIWLYRTSGDTDDTIVLYEYQPNRRAENPKDFLSSFHGYLHTDGYSGYHNLPEEITVAGCWAHARRKFDEAMKSLPKGKAKDSSAAQGLAYCTLLFEIEKGLAELPPNDRYTQRLAQAKPVLGAFLAWANVWTATPKSALGKAPN